MSFFTDANLGRARDIVAQYPRPKSAILPLAHLAQDQHGWLPPEAIEQIAELTGVTAADALGTCSFYTMLKRRPCGKLLVSVCTNVTCLVTGGPEVLEYLEEHYAADPDITIEEVECLAACGGAPALQDLLGGHVPASVNPISETLSFAKSGSLRILAVTGPERSPFLPEVPTMREQGFDVVVVGWLGGFVPVRTAPDIVRALGAAIGTAVEAPDMAAALAKFGNVPSFQGPEEFAATVKADLARWGPVVKASGFVAVD